nr:MAG TPA: hypothetical protein [Caudoviricetes sp.]
MEYQRNAAYRFQNMKIHHVCDWSNRYGAFRWNG